MIKALGAEEAVACAEGLAEVLLDCIAGGASVSFMADFSRAQAIGYWASVAAEVPWYFSTISVSRWLSLLRSLVATACSPLMEARSASLLPRCVARIGGISSTNTPCLAAIWQ